MSITDRAEIINYQLAQTMGSHVILGSCFAFVKADLFKTSAFSWLQSLIGKQASTKMNIVHLFKAEGVEIAGVKMAQVKLDKFDLCSITCDKPLYKADNDIVDLLLLNPVKANQSVVVTLQCNGALYAHRHVSLGAHGEGKLTLQDLPAGDYEALFEGSTDKNRYCKFTVAQYKLVPLVAEMKNRTLGGDQLQMTVKLSTFGVPVNGPVAVTVLDRGIRQHNFQTEARDGIASFGVKLMGPGPHSLNFQLVDDPGKTASLPIVGSRESERSQTLFNPLGTEIFGSLLPAEDATELRGVYLTEGGLTSSPIRLEYDEKGIPRLITAAAITALTIVRMEPSFPQARPDAVNVDTHQHPSHYDEEYNGAVRLFERELYEDSLRLFNTARAKQSNPHPYYAYYAACCHAKLNRVDHALDQLRLSILDGWNDFAHMQTDPDLSNLHKDERFAEISSGGFTEFKFEDLPVHHQIDIPGTKAVTLLALGAVVDNQPWEGWTSYISPTQLNVKVESDGEFKSGQMGRLKVKVNCKNKKSIAYMLVKDARLLSQDKPEARLAASIKEYVQGSSKELKLEFPSQTLAQVLPLLPHNTIYKRLAANAANDAWGAPAGGRWGAPAGGGWGAAPTDSWGGAAMDMDAMSGSSWSEEAEQMQTGMMLNRVSQSPPAPAPSAQPAQQASRELESRRAMMRNLEGGSDTRARSLQVSTPLGSSGGSYGSSAGMHEAIKAAFALAENPAKAQVALLDEDSSVIQKGHEPEVIFADFVEIIDGEAELELAMPLAETDYIVECFVISDWDWCSTESRFRAVSDPLAEFTLPRFVSAGDFAQSWLHVGCRSDEFTCAVTHNGKLLELSRNRKAFSPDEMINEVLVNLQFAAGPGTYRAVLADKKGKVISQIEQRVDEPGKLRRQVRSMRMLKAGETISLKEDPSILALRILPGLKESFELLLDATSDYGHCCCEQTAAKIMSGCAMYMFAGDDHKRKQKAEAVIIAGIKREEKMWLRSRGFKSYPERPDVPDQHYGMAAAQHLSNLALLDSKLNEMSKDLRAAVQLGTQMSSDALAAYRIEFPPRKISSMKDAYTALRFSSGGGSNEEALKYVRSKTANVDAFLKGVEYNPMWGYQTNCRIEAAYAAAALMRQKNSADLGTALKLANHVIKGFNEQGRLYSTIDSVAAIALFAEMTEARLVGGAGAGNVEINGAVTELAAALKHTEVIESVKCCEGVLAVEIESEVLEDWDVFSGKIALRVALEKNGQASRNFKLGDEVNLKVKLEQGYKDGDLLWLCLPDSLSRVYGGGQVKLFSLDFKDESELVVPLAVTGSSEGPDGKKGQHKLAVCVRNMYEEERGGNPGLIPISISQ